MIEGIIKGRLLSMNGYFPNRKSLIILAVLGALCITTSGLAFLFIDRLVPQPPVTPYPPELVTSACTLFAVSPGDTFCAITSLESQNYYSFQDAVRRWFPIPGTEYTEVMRFLADKPAEATCAGGEFETGESLVNGCPLPQTCNGDDPYCTFEFFSNFGVMVVFDENTGEVLDFLVQRPSAEY
ncbi:MAG: hypothetical protein IAE89_03125 [Anaerolineae bacterium]|nr:hypothetical protein [Anaerolineae bacterium]